MTSPILITGAGRRVGLHIARILPEHGYEPLVHYHNRTDAVDELERQGHDVVQADFDDRAGILSFVDDVRESYGTLGGIIHNASMFADTSSDLESAAEQYSNFFHVHMMAPFLITEGLMDCLLKSDRGTADVIAMTDMYVERPKPEIDTYSSTKAGLKNLVESGARKYAPEVKVNAIAPGPVLFEEGSDETYRRSVLEKTPMNREGGLEALLDVVLMILDHDFLNGAEIPVDGGRRLT